MAITDDRTTNLDLPLPHKDNPLNVDVQRVRDALGLIDGKFQALDDLLESDDVTLDQVQELVNSIKASRSDIEALLHEHEENIILTASQTVVDMLEIASTVGVTVFIEGIRLSKDLWTPDPSIMTRFTLSTSYPAGHVLTVVRRQGAV